MSSQPLIGKQIVLGITGSIAAYKSIEIANQLTKLGASVHPVLTKSASKIITPVALQTLSHNPVSMDMWSTDNWKPDHIALADRADLILVAPATAHKIACFAHGLAPDLLSSIYLATVAPIIIAPAMNGKMLKHPATQANINTLKERQHQFVDPSTGMLACGYEGDGKLAPVEEIVLAVLRFFDQSS